MKFSFSQDFYPPAPSVSIRIALPEERPFPDVFTALLDTGSDGTIFPLQVLQVLDPPLLYTTKVRGISGPKRELPVFQIDILFDQLRISNNFVIGDDQGEDILIGRNLLNKLVFLLDGPNAQTDLYETRPKIRP